MKHIWVWILLQCFKVVNARIAPLDPESQQALGLESGKIPDRQIYASESVSLGGYRARYCRLNNKSAWCIENDRTALDEYFSDPLAISFDFIYNIQINAIALQGYKTYRYGKNIRIRYFHGGSMQYYSENGLKTITVKNFKGDNYEYRILNPPIHASKLLVQLSTRVNTKCLRMEMYGNLPGKMPQRKEFSECTQTNIGLVTKHLGKTFFTQSRFLAQQVSFNAEHLPINMPYAWCLEKDNVSSPYKDWASVNLKAKHLIYGLHVDGFRDVVDKPSDKFLPRFFKFQYSLDFKLWADYEGGRELRSLTYSLVSGKKLLFKIPLLAQYLRIRMNIESRNKTCIKLQVYGCPAIKAPGRIFHYKIYQGDSNSTNSWEDTKYPHNPTPKEGFLPRDTGCLTDGEHLKTSSPLTSDCWIGWNKTSRPKPLVALTLTAVSRIYAVKLLTYVNESMQAGTIQRFSVEAGRSVPIPTLGYVCAPDSMYYISPQVIEYTIDLGGVLANEISIKFDYSMEWIFLRQVSIVQEIPVAAEALKLSPKYPTCKTPAKPTKLDDKKGKLPNYLPWLSLPALLVVAVIVLLLLRRRCNRRDKTNSSINEHYAGLKKYKNPTYTDLKEKERQVYPDLQNHESLEYADLKKNERQVGAGLLEHESPEYADLTMDDSYGYVDVEGKERHGYEDLQKHDKPNYVDLQKHENPIYKNFQNHESSGYVNFKEDESSACKDLNRHESSNYEELNHDYEVEMPPDL